jgi:hypothetical protein
VHPFDGGKYIVGVICCRCRVVVVNHRLHAPSTANPADHAAAVGILHSTSLVVVVAVALRTNVGLLLEE